MFDKMKYLAVALFLGACMGTEPTVSIPSTHATVPLAQSAMPKGDRIAPPAAFATYCLREPDECKLPSDDNTVTKVTEALEQTKKLVIPQMEEGEYWKSHSQPAPGDCEDFALTMRKILRGKFPAYSGAFLMVTAYTEDDQYHAVLSIETDRGTLICDIRYPNCASWETLPYTWHMRETASSRNWQVFAAGQAKATAQIMSGRR
ncbi:MAG: transglutaminase-like cysteine peptidase [Alphaproteobacteria bacterium]|nr:transglutaminase-like cysteine peptidase [Alphaproteobacteria bacterium]